MPEIVRTTDPFGLGIGHAFGDEAVAFRYDPGWAATLEDQRRFWETLSLGGPIPGGTIPPGYEAEGFKKPAADFAKMRRSCLQFLKEGMDSDKRSDYIEDCG